MFLRILGQNAAPTILPCVGGCKCPNILEMDSGDFAIIGTDITVEAEAKLLVGSGCGPGERIVRIPREVLLRAKPDIISMP